MLAAHRDQENVVHDHSISGKQVNKSSGKIGKGLTKTPHKIPLNDENTPAAFRGKLGTGSSAKFDKLATVKGHKFQQFGKTPTAPASRAPLGNKTTNAKARAGIIGDKSILQTQPSQIKSQPKKKSKPAPNGISQLKFVVKPDARITENGNEEPEYAPPNSVSLAFSTDDFPENGLTFEGLKPEHVFKNMFEDGDPLDDCGIRRSEHDLDRELERATERMNRDFNTDSRELDWSCSDIYESKKVNMTKEGCAGERTDRSVRKRHEGAISSVASRQAFSTLGIRLDPRIAARALSGSSKPRTAAGHSRHFLSSNVNGEATSRTTIGYIKERAVAPKLCMEGSLPLGRHSALRADMLSKEVPDFKLELSEDEDEQGYLDSSAVALDIPHTTRQGQKPAVPATLMSLFDPDSEGEDEVQIDLPDSWADAEGKKDESETV